MRIAPITIRSYVIAWGALVLLSGATLGLSFLPLGAFHLPVALLIATTKATFVVLIFMHMAEQDGSSRVALAVSVLLLAILVALTAADIATRAISVKPPVSG